ATPSYAWFVNGVNVGAPDSPVFTTSTLNDGESVYCEMTSSESCVTNSPAQSNTVAITVISVPVVPTVDVQCVGTYGAGVVTVTDPIGVEYTYSIDGITYQSEPVFDDVANGTYTLIVDNAGCTNQSAEFTVDCACDNPASLVLSSTTDIACSDEDYVLSSNTFGGSATEVSVTHNGYGALEQSVFTTSPFEIVYIQDPADLNTDITFTVTTDDPPGDLCEPVSEQLIVTVNESPVVEVVADTIICVNEQFTYTLTDTYDGVYWSDGTNGNTYSVLYNEVMIDTVTVTVESNGCFVTDTMILDIQICDFIDMANDMRINLYPNPAKDVVHMEIFDYHGKFAVSLVNMQGQVIENVEYTTDGEFNTSFDMQNLTPGLYLYRIEMNDKLHHFKIVKQ
ncbi:MAG: T9SS type A sorting domain-containing protein, partial [Bacteroidota bacterium]|nr:T9SS type A sorting domain-containing protein [Bacteroidota bacterium]